MKTLRNGYLQKNGIKWQTRKTIQWRRKEEEENDDNDESKEDLITQAEADADRDDYPEDEQAMKIFRFVLVLPVRHEILFSRRLKGGMARNWEAVQERLAVMPRVGGLVDVSSGAAPPPPKSPRCHKTLTL